MYPHLLEQWGVGIMQQMATTSTVTLSRVVSREAAWMDSSLFLCAVPELILFIVFQICRSAKTYDGIQMASSSCRATIPGIPAMDQLQLPELLQTIVAIDSHIKSAVIILQTPSMGL
jgi:hypothetical protein